MLSRQPATLWAAVLLLAAAVSVPAAAQEPVRVWEGELTLPTYALLPDDPNPQFRETDGSIVYPYTMQDNLGSERADHTWRAFFLENEYLKIACLRRSGAASSGFSTSARTSRCSTTTGSSGPA